MHYSSGLFRLLLLLLGALTCAFAQTTPPSPTWPPVADDLPADDGWHFGRLDNGLRYALRKNSLPANHVSLRLTVEVGFAHESPAEAGLSHFVEHMVFNGTRRYPGNSLVAEMQRHGVAIGPELSAFTFLTHTLYLLEGPGTAPADLNRWFGVLREFADGATFEAREVRQERKVIASELRDRESVGTRAEAARRQFLHPASPLGRLSHGAVEKVDRHALRKFYDTWYRPERMLLVAVGDLDVAELEAAVQREFQSLRARAPAPEPTWGRIGNPDNGRFLAKHDPLSGTVFIEVNSILPAERGDSAAQRRLWMTRQLAITVLNQRFRALIRQQQGRVMDASARSLLPTPFSLETSVGVQTPADHWREGLQLLEQELRRSLEFTFTSAEIAEAKQAFLTHYEQALATTANKTSSDRASDAAGVLLWGMVPISPETELALACDHLARLDALTIAQAWRGLWQPRRASVFAYGYLPYYGATELVATAYEASAATPIEGPKSEELTAFAYDDFGPPGEIVERAHDDAIDVHLVRFANGVRLNLKRTTFEQGTARFVVRLGEGMLTEPADKPGLGNLVSAAFIGGGLGRHKPHELARLISSKTVQLQFTAEEDAFAFRGQSSTRDLDHALTAIAAFMTDAGWDADAFAQTSAAFARHSQGQNYSPEGVLGLHVYRVLAGDDSRYALARDDELRACRLEDARDWLTPQLKAGQLEVGLIGDFDPEETIAAVARTLGALPARSLHPLDGTRPVRLQKTLEPQRREFPVFGEPTRGGVQIVWPLSRCGDVAISRRLEVLSAILQDRLRLKIREEMGAAYVPVVSFWRSDASPDDGYFAAYLSAKPKEIPKLTRQLRKLAHHLALHGATADELAQARAPLLARSIADRDSNDYWTRHIIGRAQTRPEVRTWPLTRENDLRTMTLADVNALARQVLQEDTAIVFTAQPLFR